MVLLWGISLIGKKARSFRQRRLILKDEFNSFSICKVKPPGGAKVG